MRHERLRLDPMEVAIARLLDGTHTAADICVALEPAIRDGHILVRGEPKDGDDKEPAPASIEEAIALLPTAVAERVRLLTVYALIEPIKGAWSA